jgi:hypothetical protein
MNDASNPQNAYPAFWRRSRLSPKVRRNNFLLLSSPLTTAIGPSRHFTSMRNSVAIGA